jgi:3-deoxy-manno-octulosonate cytidylyltransferase (CMP-KDO synthetase)
VYGGRHKTLWRETIATAQPVPIILDSPQTEKPETHPGEKPESKAAPHPDETTPLTVLGVIPARLASTRLARKVLRTIAGRPMLAWVYEAASACPQLNRVTIATDSDEVADLCHRNNWPFQLTSPDLPSGTDRVHAVARHIHADIYVNIQGDEPLLKPQHLTALLRPFRHAHAQVSTLKVLCTTDNITNPNAVKVVTAADGRALYFSRATIPFNRDPAHHPTPQYWKHIGLYAYRKATLDRFPTLPASILEQTERLEQLRFLENNIDIYVEPTNYDTIGVDTEEDLHRVETLLHRR